MSVEQSRKSKKKGKKRKSESKGRKSKSKSKVPKIEPRPEAEDAPESPGATASDVALEVLSSFDDRYQDIIKQFPRMLWPSTAKHGAHSYTATLILHKTHLISLWALKKVQ